MAARNPVIRPLIHVLFFLFRHLRVILCLLALLILTATGIFFTIPFGNDISRMLPDDSESARCYRKVADSAMFNKAPLLFRSGDPDLFRSAAFADKLARFIRSLETEPEIRRADWRLMSSTPTDAVREMVPYLPQYLPAPQWDAASFVTRCRNQFLLPSATGRAAMIEADPSGLTGQLFLRLEAFRRISHFTTSLDTPFVVSPDGKHLLVLLETASPPADPVAGRRLMDSISGLLRFAGFTPGEDVMLLFPHRRAAANEAVLKKDIMMVTILSLVIFSLLIVFIYRCEPGTFLIPAIPFLSALYTAALMPLIFRVPLFFVVGMGGIVISLALDYGIHIYGAMTEKMPLRSLGRVIPPLAVAAATSCAAFFLFLTSATDAIRQLGFFSGTSLLISLFLMLVLLPPALKRRKEYRPPVFRWDPVHFSAKHPRLVPAVWCALLVLSLACLPMIRMYSDVRQFDLSPEEYDREDAMIPALFQEGKSPGMALFEGDTPEEALAYAARAAGDDCFTPDTLSPLPEIRAANLDSWRKIDWVEFQTQVRAEAEKQDFDPEFFTPFLETIRKGVEIPPAGVPGCFQDILNRLLVQARSGNWNTAVMYRETEESRNHLASLEHSTVISAEHFPKVMARDIAHGILPLAMGAILIVILFTFFFFRSVKYCLLSLLPVVSGLLFTAAFFAVIGKGINIPVLTGGIILCGLAVDYGIFAIHAVRTGETSSIFRSMTLSAITTAAGGLTVAFTRHPMLRDAGQTIIAGILFAWFAALFLMPSLLKIRKRLSLFLCCAGLIFTLAAGYCGCDPGGTTYSSIQRSIHHE